MAGIIHLLHIWHHLESGQKWAVVGLVVVVVWSISQLLGGGGQ